MKKKRKKKKWLICLSCIKYDEFIIFATTKSAARKQVQKEIKEDWQNYGDMKIDTITEAK